MTTFDSSMFAQLENKTGYNKTNESEILNPFVNFFNSSNVQNLADVLVAESVQMRGIEFYYIPREFVNMDKVFGEDLENKFTKAWKFAAYLDNFEGYEGANTFYSKFGMMVNDEINLTINPKLFKYQVDGQEPKEGSLIYFAKDKSLFEITWVQPYDPFYQVGQNAMRRITAQKFIYSGEEIKPVLQYNEGINVPEFSELELEPIHNLDGRFDTSIEEYAEDIQINSEADEWREPYVVINNKGTPAPKPQPKNDSPFDDFMN